MQQYVSNEGGLSTNLVKASGGSKEALMKAASQIFDRLSSKKTKGKKNAAISFFNC